MKFHFFLKKLTLAFVIIFTSLNALAQCYEGVCRLAIARCFEHEAEIGHIICGNNTSNMFETKIYITSKDGYLYAQSNYIVPGYDFEYPSKLSSKNVMDLEKIMMNIFYAERPNEFEFEVAKSNMLNQVEFVVDPKIINDYKFSSTNFYSAQKLKFICPDDTYRDALILNKKKGDIEYLIRYNKNISTRIYDQNLSYIFSNIQNSTFKSENIKILSLLENAATKRMLSKDFSDKTVTFKLNINDFKKELISNKGKQIIILGHIENDNFITLDKGGKEIFKISLEEINKFKKENNLSILLLGCNSGVTSGTTGVLNKFVSTDVLKRLKIAITNNTIESFLNDLSDETLDFVLDQTFFTAENISKSGIEKNVERIDFDVFTKQTNDNKEIFGPPVGRVIFLDSIPITQSIPPLPDIIVPSSNEETHMMRNIIYTVLSSLGIILIGNFIFKSKR